MQGWIRRWPADEGASIVVAYASNVRNLRTSPTRCWEPRRHEPATVRRLFPAICDAGGIELSAAVHHRSPADPLPGEFALWKNHEYAVATAVRGAVPAWHEAPPEPVRRALPGTSA